MIFLPINQKSFGFARDFFHRFLKQVQNFIVGDEIAAFHDVSEFFAFISASSDFGTQKVSGAEMAKAKYVDNFGTLCAFAWARTSENPNNWNIVAACL